MNTFYQTLKIGEETAFIENEHHGRSLTNCIEDVMCEHDVSKCVYYSVCDRTWNTAEIDDDGVVRFGEPDRDHPCWDLTE